METIQNLWMLEHWTESVFYKDELINYLTKKKGKALRQIIQNNIKINFTNSEFPEELFDFIFKNFEPKIEISNYLSNYNLSPEQAYKLLIEYPESFFHLKSLANFSEEQIIELAKKNPHIILFLPSGLSEEAYVDIFIPALQQVPDLIKYVPKHVKTPENQKALQMLAIGWGLKNFENIESNFDVVEDEIYFEFFKHNPHHCLDYFYKKVIQIIDRFNAIETYILYPFLIQHLDKPNGLYLTQAFKAKSLGTNQIYPQFWVGEKSEEQEWIVDKEVVKAALLKTPSLINNILNINGHIDLIDLIVEKSPDAITLCLDILSNETIERAIKLKPSLIYKLLDHPNRSQFINLAAKCNLAILKNVVLSNDEEIILLKEIGLPMGQYYKGSLTQEVVINNLKEMFDFKKI